MNYAKAMAMGKLNARNMKYRKPITTMYFKIKQLILSLLKLTHIFLLKLPRGRFILSEFLEYQISRSTKVDSPEGEIKFLTPNWLTFYRANTFFSKEPETISWIRSMRTTDLLWDIGANVGTYSIFAARRGLDVVAIEPSFLNLEILCRNIIANNLEDKVIVFPIALDSQAGVQKLFMSKENMLIGGAHNSIRQELNQFGNKMENSQVLHWPTLTIDRFAQLFGLKNPTHIKIDVDGCELEILQGGIGVLNKVSSILVEMHEENPYSELIEKLLTSLGFICTGHQSNESFNRIWKKIR
jgi:FkbM family methyltransferase